MIREIIFRPYSAYVVGGINLLLFVAALGSLALEQLFIFVPLIVLAAVLMPGYFIVDPNESKVLVLFGKYVGTVSAYGFHWANPFLMKTKVSLRARNLDGDKIKVNDNIGNPIIIGAAIVWRVNDTAKATFAVDDYTNYVKIQSDAAVRDLAGKFPYDCFADDDDDATKETDITLRSGGEKINEVLEKELSERLEMAGIEVLEARLTHLAYSEEIASAMLQRQQATAIIAARRKIVEGAVGMVEMALVQLAKDNLVELDEERKAAMISNLLVVLCGDRSATPVVNTGTLYH